MEADLEHVNGQLDKTVELAGRLHAQNELLHERCRALEGALVDLAQAAELVLADISDEDTGDYYPFVQSLQDASKLLR